MSKAFEAIVNRENLLLCNTYARYPLAISHAKDCYLYDFEGEEYLDLLSGIAVCSLGHSRSDLADVMSEQARKLVHASNLFYQNEQLDLAERLVATCAAEKVFFCNSGAEANEGAIKLARRYMKKIANKDAVEIVTLERSFHGRTLCTLTATGQKGLIKDGFSPLPAGFKTIPFDDNEALEATVSEKTCAVLIEMIQGEGGVRPLSAEYISKLCQLKEKYGFLIIVDEVQTGLCRTGAFWAHQHYGLTPDIFTVAKALANGLPMGALLTTCHIAQGFEPGSHATTFGGGAVLSAVASKVVDIMVQDKIAEKTKKLGAFAQKCGADLKKKYPDKIAGIRGMGLLLGIELKVDGKPVWEKLLKKRFVCNLTQGSILRLAPPLIIKEEQLRTFFETLDTILANDC